MLIIKGICLLFSHLPTSHTTVRAVPHTAVSCFLISRCVASCFQPSLRDTSLLFYCRIPSYRVNREFLFGHLTTKKTLKVAVIYCCTARFSPSLQTTRVLGTMTSADFSRQALLRHGTSNTSSSPCVRETSSDKGLFFPSYTHFIYTNHSEQLQDFDLFGNLIHGHMPYMKFLYVRPDVCRLLLSDSTSQWTPLLLAIQFPLLGLVRDLHPLE